MPSKTGRPRKDVEAVADGDWLCVCDGVGEGDGVALAVFEVVCVRLVDGEGDTLELGVCVCVGVPMELSVCD